MSPYELVYGKEVLLPISMENPTLQLLKSIEVEQNGAMEVRLAELLEVQESREKVHNAMNNRQQIAKIWFDRKRSNPIFKQGDLVLKYNKHATKLRQREKFDALWEGPSHIINCKQHYSFELENLEANVLKIPSNGMHLKHLNYFPCICLAVNIVNL
ncbi:uncharacterized protein LOC131874423 [Cryptomeria japonica]|uniref:uncharacterized protein LOC131874423 n=1 Tax=Cryptomeria japonica TaxID=3369 RepID=UPI0027D9E6D2|nr:uncharacterized protein LOC131874423 [Cryptomeria japonica]